MPTRFDYGEIDHCCQNFRQVDTWLDERGLQRTGTVGHATARLIRSRAIIEVVTERLRSDETRFLHPLGVDAECDDARASIAALPDGSMSEHAPHPTAQNDHIS